jgi:hypothetical protein
LNPHLTLTLNWFESTKVTNATNPEWTKWKASYPTCPHWYDAESLSRLIAAYLSHDMDNGRERLVREFVSEFRELSGSTKQKVVLESTGLARQPLSIFVKNGSVDGRLACSLLEAMKRESKPVQPQMLGAIGKEHLETRFRSYGYDPNSFRYKRIFLADPIPEVYEFAFGYCPEHERRRIVAGVNWSPGILNPFRSIGRGYSMDSILSEAMAGPNEPIIVFLHVASPGARYTDRGKSAVVVE